MDGVAYLATYQLLVCTSLTLKSLTYNTWRWADYYDNASMGHKSREKLSAETGTALNPFFLGPSVLYRLYYGRDSPVREGSAIQRQPSPSAGQVPGGGVANKDERAYIDVLSFLNSCHASQGISYGCGP
jgi:hypothetical protein